MPAALPRQADVWRRFPFLLACCLAVALPAAAARSPLPYGISDYMEAESSGAVSSAWQEPPGLHKRLYLDVYNLTDFYDFETSSTAGFPDGTFFADTLRPTATLMWDERFRIQLGLIALRGYGDKKGLKFVDPWIQLLWQPVKPLSVLFGSLDTPHYFLPALFYPVNYVREATTETGVQLLYQQPAWYDDFYFNYRRQDTAESREKFDLGFVHRNAWHWLRLAYQAHWVHEGGELNPHDPLTINDVAQTVGLGAHHDLSDDWGLGAKWHFLYSHYRADSDTPANRFQHDGEGNLYSVYGRWRRMKLMASRWIGHQFRHEGGDRLFTKPRLWMLTYRWDILVSRDFSLLAEWTGYWVGRDREGEHRNLKSAIHVQAAWQFSIPLLEWTTGSPTPEGQPVPPRWDEGL